MTSSAAGRHRELTGKFVPDDPGLIRRSETTHVVLNDSGEHALSSSLSPLTVAI